MPNTPHNYPHAKFSLKDRSMDIFGNGMLRIKNRIEEIQEKCDIPEIQEVIELIKDISNLMREQVYNRWDEDTDHLKTPIEGINDGEILANILESKEVMKILEWIRDEHPSEFARIVAAVPHEERFSEVKTDGGEDL